MIPALRKILECLRESGLNLFFLYKCEFGMTKIDYLGSAITQKEIPPESAKIEKFPGQIKMPNTVKLVKCLVGFVQFSRIFIPIPGQKLAILNSDEKKAHGNL